MSNKSISNYIKQSLAKGYHPEQIRNALINAGHNPYEIDLLLRKTTQKKPGYKILIISAAVIIMTIIIIAAILLISKEEQTPSISISSPQTEITKGDRINLNIQIINPTEKKVSAILNLMLFSKGGPLIKSKKRMLNIKEYMINIPEQMEIDLPPGEYTLKLTASLGVYTLTKEMSVKVMSQPKEQKPTKIKTPTEQRKEQKKECMGNCDDYNACTKDYCEDGECKHEDIVPCCGNGICEEGEDISCIDCIEEKKQKEEQEEKKEKDRETKKTADIVIKECKQIATIANRDNCLDEAATKYGISQICKELSDNIKKDSCYMSFALDGDYSVCDKISNKYTRNSCNNLKMMSGE